MNRKKMINDLVKKRVLLLDGAMGTQLHEHGMRQGVCPEEWCVRNPALLEKIHREYLFAGADIIYTSTFGANRIKLKQYHISHTAAINTALARIARKAAGEKGLVAGDIGPTGEFVKPFGALGFEDAVALFKEQARGLYKGGVDLFVIETMMDIQEARAALIAVKEVCDLFVMVTLTFEKEGRTLNGTDPLSALITLQALGADAIGCNCSTGPKDMLGIISKMKPFATVPLAAKPNAGMPRLLGARTAFDMDAKAFASYAKQFVGAGVNFLGGCCGTTPGHIASMCCALKREKPSAVLRGSLSAVCSSRQALIIEKDNPLIVVGERINPTGKKDLQQELRRGKMSLLRRMAADQELQGAQILDVNVGVEGIDEKKTFQGAIEILSATCDLPLSIDSSNLEAIEAALRLYPGRALINSVSGEKNKLNRLLPLAAKYGAMCILLPLNGKKVPQTAQERKQIIKEVLARARRYGLGKDSFIIDGLALSIASNPNAAQETLKTIAWCSQELGCHTLVGLSNISFGLPQRMWLNAAFLALAYARGLTMAIANTASIEVKNIRMACDVLSGRDSAIASLRARFSKANDLSVPAHRAKPLSAGKKIFYAVLEGAQDDIQGYIQEAMRSGMSALRIVNSLIIPAIKKTGLLFDRKIYFLPQLMASAQVAKNAFGYLKPFLKKERAGTMKKAVIVLATVKGDIHDIGKNIVSLMLHNQGFAVIDLGKDVSAERIVKAASDAKADIVGLSALMTTTMVNMKEVIALSRARGLRCAFMVGGAAVTRAYAASLHAKYGKDAVEAVRIAQRLHGR